MVEPLEAADPGLARAVSMLIRQLRLEGVILLPPLSDLVEVRSTLAAAGIPATTFAS